MHGWSKPIFWWGWGREWWVGEGGRKIRKIMNIINLWSAEFAQRVVKVNLPVLKSKLFCDLQYLLYINDNKLIYRYMT